jgi:hypothetical protein
MTCCISKNKNLIISRRKKKTNFYPSQIIKSTFESIFFAAENADSNNSVGVSQSK